jgi:O-antigen/teichoic acid export membrane protein
MPSPVAFATGARPETGAARIKERVNWQLPDPIRTWLGSDTAFLIIANIAGSAFGYFFLVAMGRMLEPGLFGTFGALFAIFYVTCLVGQALREAIAVSVAETRALHGEAQALAGFVSTAKRLGLYSLIPAVLFVAAAGPIATFFHLPSALPVIILGISIFTALGLDIVLGLQQGLQQFRGLGLTGFYVSQGLKLILGVVMVWIGWGLNGAAGALLASTTLAIIFGLGINRRKMAEGARHSGLLDQRLSSILVPAIILGIFIAVPTSIDVMLVSHFIGGWEAGAYNAAATMGKVVIFLPMAVSFVLLPRVSEGYHKGEDTRGRLKQALAAAVLLSGAVTLVIALFPDFTVKLFFGDAYAQATGMVRLYGAAMLVCSLNIVLIHYGLAVKLQRLLITADIITALEIAAICLWHDSLTNVIWILLAGNLVVLGISLPWLLLRKAPPG